MIWTIEDSPFAQGFLKRLNDLSDGKVLNRSDLISGEPGAERDLLFGLDPEWMVVVLAALIRQGSITLTMPGYRIGEGDTDTLYRMGIEDLWKFSSISRPKPLPEKALRELFSSLDLDPALLDNPHTLETAAAQLDGQIQEELDRVLRLLESLRNGPRCWGETVLLPDQQSVTRGELDKYRQFLASLENLNTPARLRNLTVSLGEIKAAFKTRRLIAELNQLIDTLLVLQPNLEYLIQAQSTFPINHSWQEEAANVRAALLADLRNPTKVAQAGFTGQLKGRLENLISAYCTAYMQQHQRARLDREWDDRKRRLTTDTRFPKLRSLAHLNLLPMRRLEDLQQRLDHLHTCSSLDLVTLRTHAVCPHCGFAPNAEDYPKPATELLESIEHEFDTLYQQWVATLLQNLRTPEAEANLDLLKPAEREAVTEFITSGQLPDKMGSHLLDGLRDTLQGLEKLTIEAADLMLALASPTMPCTAQEFQERFGKFLADRLQGKNTSRLRIHLDW